MYTVYVCPDVVSKFHKDISTSYEDIDQIFAWSFLKFVINLINDHLLWNRGKILTPTIAFTLTTEYVQVMEGKKNMFQITFFSTLSVTTYVQVSLLLLIYITGCKLKGHRSVTFACFYIYRSLNVSIFYT